VHRGYNKPKERVLAVHSGNIETTTGQARIYHPQRPLVHPALDLEIIFVFDGELEVREGQRTRRLKEPDVLLLNAPSSPFQRAIARPITINPLGDCFFLLLKIAPSLLLSAFDGTVPVFDCDSTVQNKDFTVIRGILAEIASAGAERGKEGCETGLMFHSRLYRVLEELRAHFTAQRDDTPAKTEKTQSAAGRSSPISKNISVIPSALPIWRNIFPSPPSTFPGISKNFLALISMLI
jgi:hypothetical protein